VFTVSLHVVTELIGERYERTATLIVTSNLDFTEWD
jgi:DNA replication protein DnaC